MKILDIFFIGISLAMDAFAVSICKGLAIKKINTKKCIKIGTYFGLFQALMPLIGYFIGNFFDELVVNYDHWIAFILLSVLGANMIIESINEKDDDEKNEKLDFKTMILLSIATSIDALAVGITFSFLDVNIIMSSSIIGVVTFILCIIGVIIGNKIGNKLSKKASIFGGVVLIALGVKILLEHLNII